MSAALQPHQQRVVAEKSELDERLAKLLAFFQTEIFAKLDAAERSRLRNQARFMDGYSAVLGERIEAFTAAEAKPESKRYRHDDIDRHSFMWHVDSIKGVVNVRAVMNDGKEFRSSFAPSPGDSIQPAAARHILAVANGEAS